MSELHYLELTEAAELIRNHEITSVDLTTAVLDRIATLDPSLHSYATVTADLALAQAKQADADLAAGTYRGPLHGVPIAIKDLLFTAGVRTAGGMPIVHGEHVPDYDATVVRRLHDAGAVLLGKLQHTEGAFVHHHPDVVRPVNPWAAEFYAGASSSGPGVATAAGLCFGSLGTDTGGSIRFPSAANALTGIKPTWGLVSRYGCFALAESLDHIGPLARSARDAGAVLGVIAGHDPNDPTSLPFPARDYLSDTRTDLAGIRIGVDAAWNERDVDATIVATVAESASALAGLGAEIVPVVLPDPGPVTEAWSVLSAAEAAAEHAATFPSQRSAYGPLQNLLDAGHQVTGIDYAVAQRTRLAVSGSLELVLHDVDLLLVPTQPVSDFTVEQEKELFATSEGLNGFIRFATPFDMSGHPTIMLPNGFTERGLPLSFQLAAGRRREDLLVRAGQAYQSVTTWHKRHPQL